jgi:chemotaxis signal transduction protein
MQIVKQETNPENGQNAQQHLTFRIGGEECASLLKVRKFLEYDTDTEVLRTWEWIRGMSGARSAGKNGQGRAIPSDNRNTKNEWFCS